MQTPGISKDELYDNLLGELEAQAFTGETGGLPPDIVDWAEDHIILPTGGHIQLEDHQKAILRHVFDFSSEDGKLPYNIIVYSCPKKSGKTAINSVVMTYWGFNIEAPNEIIVAANKRDQAIARAYNEMRGYIERNPTLLSQTEKTGERGISLKNGTIITPIPNDFSGEAGSNHGLVSHDELWGATSERDHRLFDELTPVPTRKNSIRLITTYAGFEGESKLLEEIYHEIFDAQHNMKEGVSRPLGEDFPCYAKGELFLYWDHKPRMPWQTPEYYRSQKQQLRKITYLRLHENRWVSSESGLFDMDKFDACVDVNHKPPLPNKEIALFVGVDASVKKDRSAVVSVYEQDKKLCLGPKRFWQPSPEDPMDLEETMEAYLLELFRGYSLVSVRYDPFQFHRSAMTLEKKGLPMQEFPQTSRNLTEMGQNLFDLVEYGNLTLYSCKDLRYEATCAVAKETGRGLKIMKEKSSQKIDQIVSLAMAALRPTSGFFSDCDLT